MKIISEDGLSCTREYYIGGCKYIVRANFSKTSRHTAEDTLLKIVETRIKTDNNEINQPIN